MILFFDTETTGFFQDRLPTDHPDQPYIVQLAAELSDDEGKPIAGFSFIVDPGISDGVFIPDRASGVHGITNDRAVQFGVSAEFALSAFTHLYQRADIVCAHNIKFDRGVMEAAIARHYGKVMPLRRRSSARWKLRPLSLTFRRLSACSRPALPSQSLRSLRSA